MPRKKKSTAANLQSLDDDDDQVAGGTGSFLNERDKPGTVAKTTDDDDEYESTVNPWAAVGGASDQIRLSQQILAASDPKEYGRRREEALKRVQKIVTNYYNLSLESFRGAGEDLRTAENKALAATAKVKQIEMDQFHLVYPEADLGKYIGATAHESNKYFSAAAISGKKRTTRKKK